jgi:alpha-mannosidase
MRCNPGGEKQPWPAYWWEGDDGSRILALSTPEYYGHVTAGEAAQSVVQAASAGHDVALQMYGVCDHGGGPTRQSLETLGRLQREALVPRLVCSTVSSYVDALLERQPDLPVHRGESALTFRGCYTSHADAKELNRQGEELLVTADTLAALAGFDHDSDLRDAWRTHLRHQFHDILGGSSIADVYVDQATDAAAVQAVAGQRMRAALDVLHRGIPGDRIAVTNPHAWERVDVVCVDVPTAKTVTLAGRHGHVTVGQQTADGLCFVARVPGFSTVAYEIRAESDATPMSATGTDGPTVRITGGRHAVDVGAESGAVVSWRLDDSVVEIGATGLGRLLLVEEEPAPMSAWVLGRLRSEVALESGTTAVVECGPVRTVLETTHRVRQSTVRQRLHVYADLDRIDVEVLLDWQEPGGPELGAPGMKVAFDTGLAGATPSYETLFSALNRPGDGGEVPALRWGAVEDAGGRGIAVLNDSRHAYDATDGTLRLRVVRSAYEPDPHADIGRHRTRYALLPLTSGWRGAAVPRQAAAFGTALLAGRGTGGTGSQPTAPPLHVDAADNIVVAGLKPARHGSGLVVRLYESAGASGTATIRGVPDGAVVRTANVVEDELADVALGAGAAELMLRPFEVITLVIRTG